MSKTHWFDLTARDFETLDPARTIAILPLGATEQHGPHLSVGTDTLIAGGMCAEVKRRLPTSLSVLFLPVFWAGASDEHGASPGTITLDAPALIAVLTRIGESVARAGLRKLLVINSHGGNTGVMSILAQDLRARMKMLVVATSWSAFGAPEGVFDEAERLHGLHGGDDETSAMLHFGPDRVKMSKARDFTGRSVGMADDYTHLAFTGPGAMAWMAGDMHPEGVSGDAARATAAKGAKVAQFRAERVIELLHDMTKFPLADLS